MSKFSKKKLEKKNLKFKISFLLIRKLI